jgi:HEPN domain-containing protein
MPRTAVPTGMPEEWLRRAKSNLVRAKQVKPAGAYWEDLCFDTEQAAEKAVKAILTHRKVQFPKIHDIGELLSLLDQSGEKIPEEVWRVDDLTRTPWRRVIPVPLSLSHKRSIGRLLRWPSES